MIFSNSKAVFKENIRCWLISVDICTQPKVTVHLCNSVIQYTIVVGSESGRP